MADVERNEGARLRQHGKHRSGGAEKARADDDARAKTLDCFVTQVGQDSLQEKVLFRIRRRLLVPFRFRSS